MKWLNVWMIHWAAYGNITAACMPACVLLHAYNMWKYMATGNILRLQTSKYAWMTDKLSINWPTHKYKGCNNKGWLPHTILVYNTLFTSSHQWLEECMAAKHCASIFSALSIVLVSFKLFTMFFIRYQKEPLDAHGFCNWYTHTSSINVAMCKTINTVTTMCLQIWVIHVHRLD